MLVIYGPTATGKTALAIDLAKKYDGELISADSRQVYKNLDIGTGKVSFQSEVEKHSGYWIVDGIRINGFDLVKPQAPFSSANFIKFASAKALKIAGRKKLPIIVGGTGFYIKAFLEGLGTIGIEADKKLRLKLEKLSVVVLQQKLQKHIINFHQKRVCFYIEWKLFLGIKLLIKRDLFGATKEGSLKLNKFVFLPAIFKVRLKTSL